jgi:uncharacterized protein (DUF433 family)
METIMKPPPVSTIDPKVENGMPCFTGTNIPIGILFENLAEGMTVDQIVTAYPGLTRKAMCRALGEACELVGSNASRISDPEADWGPETPLGQAVAAGNIHKANLLREKVMLPGWKAAAMTGIAIEMLNRNAEDGRVLALSITKGGRRRFPAWQFDERYRNLMSEVVAALEEFDPWGKYLFFTRSEPILKGKVPLDEIQSGRGEEVLKVARILNDEY